MSGIDLIAAERQRQIEQKGMTPEHDDKHQDSSLAMVGAFYAWPRESIFEINAMDDANGKYPIVSVSQYSLWPVSWWEGHDKKVKRDRKRQLAIAGALIAAEIDRLERLERLQ